MRKKSVFLVFFVFSLLASISSRPVNAPRDDKRKSMDNNKKENEPVPEKKTKLEVENGSVDIATPPKPCYFSVERKSSDEKFERDAHSKVSTNCGGKLMKWKEVLDNYSGHFFGACHEMDLLASRGGGEYIDWDDTTIVENAKERIICENHYKELVTEWNDRRLWNHVKYGPVSSTSSWSAKCTLPSSVDDHPKFLPIAGRGVTLFRDEAKALLMKKGIHVHVGIPLCKTHKKVVSGIHSGSQFGEDTCPADSETTEIEEQTPHKLMFFEGHEVTDACQSEFYKWVDSLKLPSSRWRRVFPMLSSKQKKRKIYVAKYVLGLAMEILAPGHGEELKLLATQTEVDRWTKTKSILFGNLMHNIADEYRKAESRNERRAILSIAASSLNYQTVLEYFPGLTKYSYNKARQYAKLLEHPKQKSMKRQKYVPSHVIEFVNFITSDFVSTDLPFGRRVLKKTDGTTLEVSDTLRIVRAVEIVEMFIKLKTEKGEQDELLSRSSMYKILDSCKATNREAMQCVDYFVSDALDGFDRILKDIDTLKENELIGEILAKKFQNRFMEVKQYLRVDFKLHIKKNSRVADHCINFALTDVHDKRFSTTCSTGESAHEHDMFCERCQMLYDVFTDYNEMLKQLIDKAKNAELGKSQTENKMLLVELEEQLEESKDALVAIENLKKHEVRNTHIQMQKRKIVDSLSPTEVFLTMDWAQKFLGKQSREPQSSYYGKSGISVHVTHALSLDSNKSPMQHNFIHIMQQDLQDSTAAILIFDHVMRELKKVGITGVHIRSDNAGCYHSSGFIASLHHYAKKSGVEIKSITFSEPQGGKGPADRSANEVKNKVRKWVASKHNAETPEEIFEALVTGRLLNALSVYLCIVDVTKTQPSKTSIKLVSEYYDFRFAEDKMTVRKFGDIGDGFKLETSTFNPSSGNMKIEKEGGVLPAEKEKFWKESKCKKNCQKEVENDEQKIQNMDTTKHLSDVDILNEAPRPLPQTVFECPFETCDSQFSSAESLDRHLVMDDHFRRPEKENMIDFAMSCYSENLENWKSVISFTGVKEVMKSSSTDTAHYNVLHPGWAHPAKKKNTRYSKSSISFVKTKFDEAKTSGAKIYPKVIAKQMKSAKKRDGITPLFEHDELLNYKQITNLYHRIGRIQTSTEKEDVPTTVTPATTRAPTKSASGKKSKQASSSKTKRSHSVSSSSESQNEAIIEKILIELEAEEFDDSDSVYDNDELDENVVDVILEELQPQISEIFEDSEK